MSDYNLKQLRGAFAAGYASANGVDYPKGDPKRRKALERLKTDPLIKQCVEIEPQLLDVLNEAKYQKNEPGYHRIRRYYDLKRKVAHLVGWDARDKRLCTMEHHDAIVMTIGDLLPEDDVDLYPDGKPEVS